jgi:hypothetical protein
MALLRAGLAKAARVPGRGRRGSAAVVFAARRRRVLRSARRLTAAALGPVVAAGSALVPVAVTVSAVTAGAVVAVAKAAPAKAAAQQVLILSSSVSGGSASAEAAAATADGFTPVLESSSAWAALTSTGLSSYAAVIIGDPSSGGTCSTTPDADAEGNESVWGPQITGNVAVAGTAPALAGSAGSALMKAAIAYAASGPSGSTGLYTSLNCDYAASSDSDTGATLLNQVYGGGFDVTGQVAGSGPGCTDSGSVNLWEADASGSFQGLRSSDLSVSSWGSPACPVQETFNTWPANFTPVAYDASASPADFTATDGTSGQPYVLLGVPTPSPATLAESSTTGGAVPHGSVAGGSGGASNASQPLADAAPVNTYSGDFTQSGTDVSVPGFGPSLDFARSYDSQLAQQQERTGTPGPMGYGWTDNQASSLSTSAPIPGDIYALDGLAGAANTGDGLTAYAANGQSPAASPLGYPAGVLVSGGNIYWSDTAGNRVEEIPGASGTQWGISMTAGQTYTIAGSYTGQQGDTDAVAGTSALLFAPMGLAMGSSGNLYIADSGDDQVEVLNPNTGVLSRFAGSSPGDAGDGDPASSASVKLTDPTAVSADASGVYIADAGNNQIREVALTTGSQHGQSMTAGDIYTVFGSPAGTSGQTGNGTQGGQSFLDDPQGVSVTSTGVYVADTGNCEVEEFPRSAGTQWGITMSAGDEYAVAGRGPTSCGGGANNKPATMSDLASPDYVTAASGNLYIADTGSNCVKEVAGSSNPSELGQSMTADDIYDIAGTGAAGDTGNGGIGTAAEVSARRQ